MFELHQSMHLQHGICLWTVLTIIVFLIMVVIFIIHLVKQSKRKHDFESDLEVKTEEIHSQGEQEV